jgi:hypothetical protein
MQQRRSSRPVLWEKKSMNIVGTVYWGKTIHRRAVIEVTDVRAMRGWRVWWKNQVISRRRGQRKSSILSIYSYPTTCKPAAVLTWRFLSSGVIHSNDFALIPFVLRESKPSRLLKPLDPTDLVHRCLESIHPRSIVRQVEFLDLLNVVIVSWPVDSLVTSILE